MNAQIQMLKADIKAGLKAIAEIYATLKRYPLDPSKDEELIVIAYYLHNLYCAFESIFQRIVEVFGNQILERAGWHAELLRRMTLDIEGRAALDCSAMSPMTAWTSYAAFGISFVAPIGYIWMRSAWLWCAGSPAP